MRRIAGGFVVAALAVVVVVAPIAMGGGLDSAGLKSGGGVAGQAVAPSSVTTQCVVSNGTGQAVLAIDSTSAARGINFDSSTCGGDLAVPYLYYDTATEKFFLNASSGLTSQSGNGAIAFAVATEGALIKPGPDTSITETGVDMLLTAGRIKTNGDALELIGNDPAIYASSTNSSLVLTSNCSAANCGATVLTGTIGAYPQNALDATDFVFGVGNNVAATLFAIAHNGGVTKLATDQSADCDDAATGNAPVGKVCVRATQGAMVLTNSLITTSTIVHLTNVSDDATCLSGYATVGSGSATIGCVGAGTATANTVFAFQLTNQ